VYTVSVSAGVCGQVELVVTASDTAAVLGTGDVAVLATPRIVGLCEEATVQALKAHIPEGQTSVGFRVEISHVAPIRVGTTVVAVATLERTEGRRLVFNVSVSDECGLVAAGRITRVLVDSTAFMDKAR
jgi:predicted thioesterase